MSDLHRIEIKGTWWRFEIKPTDEEITSFREMYRPEFFEWLKIIFKPTVNTNRVWSELYPDISFFFDSTSKAWYRESHPGDTKKMLNHMATGKLE